MRWLESLEDELADRQSRHLERRLRVIDGPCETRLRVQGADGRVTSLLAFCSNDYLGLANHADVRQALAEGALQWGAGSGASHLVSGHSQAHARLEHEIAQHLSPYLPGVQVLFFSTGYMANLALMSSLAQADTAFFCDKLNHASLIDGAMLAKAWSRCEVIRYGHQDMAGLEQRLVNSKAAYKFIVTDGVFSMDGDIALLPELMALAHQYDAQVIVDDAHGYGVLGPHGEGTVAHHHADAWISTLPHTDRLILMGTLGKAAGVAGAFVAGPPTLIRWLINMARPYIYTTAAPPAIAHALQVSVAMLRHHEGQQRRLHVRQLIAEWRRQVEPWVRQQGWELLPSETPIQPLVVKDNEIALQLSRALERRGIWVPSIRPPTVPDGTARLRIVFSAAHTLADVDELVQALKDAVLDLRA